MQNNVTELTQRLLRALDNNYNVIDMPAVTEIISLLEKVSITKELLEATRLGKHVNELRRKTDNDSLSRRAKELVKKWRNMVLPVPDSNGQLKPLDAKRPASRSPPDSSLKRLRLNGQSELELSDNSNSSFKDVISSKVILINSDSNSSFPDSVHVGSRAESLIDEQPKKRGRKKGSKNHKNLLDEAETSFSNKLAVSRGNSKVKTTQELIAGLQNKNNTNLATSPGKNNKEDLNIRAQKLTERVSIIDQKLNTNANRYNKNSQKNKLVQKITIGDKSDKVIESGSVINDKSLLSAVDEDVIVVDDIDTVSEIKSELPEDEVKVEEKEEPPDDSGKILSLSVEEALSQLPPIDPQLWQNETPEPPCTCVLKHNKDFSVEDSGEDLAQEFEFVPDENCAAKIHFENTSEVGLVTAEDLHNKCLENVNGNWGVGVPSQLDCPYVNVVPNVNTESIARDVKILDFDSENYKKYSFSEGDSDKNERTESESGRVFREWHQVLDTPSYNGEIFKILPYVIID